MADRDDDERKRIKAIFEKPATAALPAPGAETGPRVEVPRLRTALPGIDPRAYEHPGDRAALATLRRVPGFDVVLRRFVGLFGERRLRFLYLASSVRVTERQFKDVYRVYVECCEILDLPRRPELYISQTPLVNAGAIGLDDPFVVLNSGTLNLLGNDELRFVIGHELGHVLSDHALYKTMLNVLLSLTLTRVGVPLGGLAIWGLIAALREWDRKSELSADRAGLLCLQDPEAAYTVHMKMAGGDRIGEMNADEFVRQADEYERGGDVRDGALKLLNLLGMTHPFPVLRLADLRRWVDGGGYGRILAGEYPRRSQTPESTLYAEIAEGARAYRDSYAESQDPLMKFVQDVGNALAEAGASMWDQVRGAFGKRGGGGGGGGGGGRDDEEAGGGDEPPPTWH